MALDYFFKNIWKLWFSNYSYYYLYSTSFFSFANFSFRSMAKMKALQPEMARLKEVHKDDKMKLQQAMMALYKKEKVNPMSGCLPILIQIPVFFALYKVLFVTIEMSHMPFYGWIQDLSAKDPTSIFNLFGLFPYDVPSFCNWSMASCYGGINVGSTKTKSRSNRSNASKNILLFFPLFLTVILAPFPSGLVIYWTVNNILTMAQQVVIMKSTTVKTVTLNLKIINGP